MTKRKSNKQSMVGTNFFVSDVIHPGMSSEWLFAALSHTSSNKEPRLALIQDGNTRRVLIAQCDPGMPQDEVNQLANQWLAKFREEHSQLEPGNAMLDRMAFGDAKRRRAEQFDIGV